MTATNSKIVSKFSLFKFLRFAKLFHCFSSIRMAHSFPFLIGRRSSAKGLPSVSYISIQEEMLVRSAISETTVSGLHHLTGITYKLDHSSILSRTRYCNYHLSSLKKNNRMKINDSRRISNAESEYHSEIAQSLRFSSIETYVRNALELRWSTNAPDSEHEHSNVILMHFVRVSILTNEKVSCNSRVISWLSI